MAYVRPFSCGLDATELSLVPAHLQKALIKASKLIAACWILYSARPEWVSPFTLPRSQRFQHGNAEIRKNYRRIMLPAVKHISLPTYAGTETGREVIGHYRGWVYRVLRNERYKRNDDGTFKTVVVPPCVVNGGPADEE